MRHAFVPRCSAHSWCRTCPQYLVTGCLSLTHPPLSLSCCQSACALHSCTVHICFQSLLLASSCPTKLSSTRHGSGAPLSVVASGPVEVCRDNASVPAGSAAAASREQAWPGHSSAAVETGNDKCSAAVDTAMLAQACSRSKRQPWSIMSIPTHVHLLSKFRVGVTSCTNCSSSYSSASNSMSLRGRS